MYKRYDKKVFYPVERCVDIINLVLPLSKEKVILVKIKLVVVLLGLLSSWKKSYIEFLSELFIKKTVIVLLIYLI